MSEALLWHLQLSGRALAVITSCPIPSNCFFHISSLHFLVFKNDYLFVVDITKVICIFIHFFTACRISCTHELYTQTLDTSFSVLSVL